MKLNVHFFMVYDQTCTIYTRITTESAKKPGMLQVGHHAG